MAKHDRDDWSETVKQYCELYKRVHALFDPVIIMCNETAAQLDEISYALVEADLRKQRRG